MAKLSLAYRNGMVVTQPYTDEDDEEVGPERILTVEEFMERLRDRTDIFGVDKNYRLRKTELIALVMAVLAGMWATSREVVTAGPIKNLNNSISQKEVTVLQQLIENPGKPSPAAVNYNAKKVFKTRTLKLYKGYNRGKIGTGVGNPLAHITKKGILGLLSGQIRGVDIVGGDIFGKGGFKDKIDAVILGVGGLKSGGRTSVNRRGEEGIGFQGGYGESGFGGSGIEGTNDIIDQLMEPQGTELELAPKTGPPAHLNASVAVSDGGGRIKGDCRSKLEIMRVVMQNIGALRYAYNRCLHEKPGIKGKITIRFAIDEIGNVIHCEVIESSMGDKDLESTVTAKIMRWKFERIDKPGDITEVVYPFVFST